MSMFLSEISAILSVIMKELSLHTKSRTAFVDVTADVVGYVCESGIESGVVTVFVPHTTAGVTINENADPDVTRDLTTILDQLIPWQNNYRHAEGNSAAHAKASLMGASVQIPVERGRLQLGTWQSIYFCEFDGPRTRTCLIQS